VLGTRLGFALERAERLGDVAAWLNLAEAIYAQPQAGAKSRDLSELRAEIRSRSENLRQTYRSRAGRLWAAQRLDELLHRLLADELGTGPLSAETFTHIEALKARNLLEALADPARATGAKGLGPQAAAAEVAMMSFEPAEPGVPNTLQDEMRLASMLPIGTLWDAAERAQQLRVIEDEYERLGIEAPATLQRASLAQIQQALEPGEGLIEYVVTRVSLHPAAEAWACLITPQAAQIIRLADFRDPTAGFIGSFAIDGRAPLDMSPLGNKVVSARTAIRDGDEAAAKDHLVELAAVLLAPIESLGWLDELRRLVVVPTGVLHYVPFSALPMLDGTPLVAHKAVTLAPSATAWQSVTTRARPPVASLIGLGNPLLSYRPDLQALPDAETELTRIAGRLEGVASTLKVGAQATEDVLATSAPTAGIVHIATHGAFPEENALDMQLVLLARSAHHDGPLHAEEVRSLDLRASRLATLSVCNGGLYRFGPGDEPYGLAPAFLIAGSENVVGTLWAIDDRLGRLFMTSLYRNLLQAGPAEALRGAADDFRQDGADIREWSAYVNVGPGRPLVQSSLPSSPEVGGLPAFLG